MEYIQEKASKIYPVTEEVDKDGNDTNYQRRCAFIQGYEFCELDNMKALNQLLLRYQIIDSRAFISELKEILREIRKD